jgi:hypothetical protein
MSTLTQRDKQVLTAINIVLGGGILYLAIESERMFHALVIGMWLTMLERNIERIWK